MPTGNQESASKVLGILSTKNSTQTPIVTFLLSSFNILGLYSRHFKKYSPSRYLIWTLCILQLFLSASSLHLLRYLCYNWGVLLRKQVDMHEKNNCFTCGTMLSLIVLSYFGSKTFLAVINLSVMHGMLCWSVFYVTQVTSTHKRLL